MVSRVRRTACLAFTCVLLASCASQELLEARDPVPEALVSRAGISGYCHIRYWDDDGDGIASGTIATLVAQ